MTSIFSKLPNDLIIKIIKIAQHVKECEDMVNDMVYYYAPTDYWDQPREYIIKDIHPITGYSMEEHMEYIDYRDPYNQDTDPLDPDTWL